MTTPRQRLERDVLPYFILAMFVLVPICIAGVIIAWLLGYVPEPALNQLPDAGNVVTP